MKGLINFAVKLPKNQHMKKKMVLSVTLYIVGWGCCWYTGLLRVSPGCKEVAVQDSVLLLAMDLGQPGKKTRRENQITNPFSKDPLTCCDQAHLRALPSSWQCYGVPKRVLLSPAMRTFVLHQTMLILTQTVRMEDSGWRGCRAFPADELRQCEAQVGPASPALQVEVFCRCRLYITAFCIGESRKMFLPWTSTSV